MRSELLDVSVDHVRVIYNAQYPELPSPDLYEIIGNKGKITKDFPYPTPIGQAYDLHRNKMVRIHPADAKMFEAFAKAQEAAEAKRQADYAKRMGRPMAGRSTDKARMEAKQFNK